MVTENSENTDHVGHHRWMIKIAQLQLFAPIPVVGLIGVEFEGHIINRVKEANQ